MTNSSGRTSRCQKLLCQEICAELTLQLPYLRAALHMEKHLASAIWKLAPPNQFGVCRSTAGEIVMEVCTAIKKLLFSWCIRLSNAQEVNGFSQIQFPNCIGATDRPQCLSVSNYKESEQYLTGLCFERFHAAFSESLILDRPLLPIIFPSFFFVFPPISLDLTELLDSWHQ